MSIQFLECIFVGFLVNTFQGTRTFSCRRWVLNSTWPCDVAEVPSKKLYVFFLHILLKGKQHWLTLTRIWDSFETCIGWFVVPGLPHKSILPHDLLAQFYVINRIYIILYLFTLCTFDRLKRGFSPCATNTSSLHGFMAGSGCSQDLPPSQPQKATDFRYLIMRSLCKT